MLHAAALIAGLTGLCLALSPVTGDARGLIAAGAIAIIVALLTARLGGHDAESAPYVRFFRLMPLLAERGIAAMASGLAVARMALAADVTLKPALVRVRLRRGGEGVRAAFAYLVSAEPGGLVVDLDGEGALVHVLEEDGVDPAALAALEGRAAAAIDGARA